MKPAGCKSKSIVGLILKNEVKGYGSSLPLLVSCDFACTPPYTPRHSLSR